MTAIWYISHGPNNGSGTVHDSQVSCTGRPVIRSTAHLWLLLPAHAAWAILKSAQFRTRFYKFLGLGFVIGMYTILHCIIIKKYVPWFVSSRDWIIHHDHNESSHPHTASVGNSVKKVVGRDLRTINVLAKFENDPWKIMDVRVLTVIFHVRSWKMRKKIAKIFFCLEKTWISNHKHKIKVKLKKVPGPPPKLSASDWRTCGNFQHCTQQTILLFKPTFFNLVDGKVEDDPDDSSRNAKHSDSRSHACRGWAGTQAR